jgi:hypothetical protein
VNDTSGVVWCETDEKRSTNVVHVGGKEEVVESSFDVFIK